MRHDLTRALQNTGWLWLFMNMFAISLPSVLAGNTMTAECSSTGTDSVSCPITVAKGKTISLIQQNSLLQKIPTKDFDDIRQTSEETSNTVVGADKVDIKDGVDAEHGNPDDAALFQKMPTKDFDGTRQTSEDTRNTVVGVGKVDTKDGVETKHGNRDDAERGNGDGLVVGALASLSQPENHKRQHPHVISPPKKYPEPHLKTAIGASMMAATKSLIQTSVSVVRAVSLSPTSLVEIKTFTRSALPSSIILLTVVVMIFILLYCWWHSKRESGLVTDFLHDSNVGKPQLRQRNREGARTPQMTSHINEPPPQVHASPQARMSTQVTNSPVIPGPYFVEDSDTYFCPELVVPQDCECMLLIPIPSSTEAFTVIDASGNAVLRVVPRGPPTQSLSASSAASLGRSFPGGRPPFVGFVLTTSQGETLGQCCLGDAPSSASAQDALEFHFYRGSGDYFARLVRGQSHDFFVLGTITNSMLYFSGSFNTHAVRVTDQEGKLLAATERYNSRKADSEGNYYRLRVAPLVDVGLVVCCLLCIDSIM